MKMRAILVIILSCSALCAQQEKSMSRPTGVIIGRVVDDDGRPMRDIEVQALVTIYEAGQRRLVPNGNLATTNDRGEFRLFWLPPGNYYIEVNPLPSPYAPRLQPPRRTLGYIPSDPDKSFVTTYFPGTADILEAEAVEVATSEVDVRAIGVTALPSRVLRVNAVNAKLTDAYIDSGLISLRSVKDSLVIFQREQLLQSLGKGSFETRAGMVPGEYRAILTVRAAGGTYSGAATFIISETDSATLDIQVSQTISLQGEVQTEGPTSSLFVTCVPDPLQGLTHLVTAQVRQNGKFVLDGVLPEVCGIRIDGIMDDRYLKSVRLGNQEAKSQTIEIPAHTDDAKLNLVVKTGGSIEGIFVNESRAAQPGLPVAAIPAGQETYPGLFRFAVTNNQGEFEVHGLAPGTYKVVALDGMNPEMLRGENFLQRVGSIEKSVTVSEGDHLKLGVVPMLKQ
jgi:hypothetical protein